MLSVPVQVEVPEALSDAERVKVTLCVAEEDPLRVKLAVSVGV